MWSGGRVERWLEQANNHQGHEHVMWIDGSCGRERIDKDSEKVFAWCFGQTAVELLQISPDEYMKLPEDKWAIYIFTLKNESFMVAIANTSKQVDGYAQNTTKWEIRRAQKCE